MNDNDKETQWFVLHDLGRPNAKEFACEKLTNLDYEVLMSIREVIKVEKGPKKRCR